jgi:hypothetical protein
LTNNAAPASPFTTGGGDKRNVKATGREKGEKLNYRDRDG